MNAIEHVHVCSFESTSHLTGKRRTYAAVKAACLEAGRFSVFEAAQTRRDACLFFDLERDPEVEIDRTLGFPWIGVRRAARASKAMSLVLLALLLAGCEKTYRCGGYSDRLIENRPGESGPPLCETPDGRFYDAQEVRP